MRLLLVEDEPLAADRLRRLVGKLLPQASIYHTQSVAESCKWLQQHSPPDLALCDIQLGDGLSFEIWERCPFNSPVIFTTAYDAYAIRAFKLNSIDYLLKPIDEEELKAALSKYEQQSLAGNGHLAAQAIERTHLQLSQQYKQRFLIKVGEQLHALPTGEILYFWNEERATFATTAEGKRYLVDYSLNQLEELLNPQEFFRVNRQLMLRYEAVEQIVAYSGSRLKLTLKHAAKKPALVSRERVNEFKAWLGA
jgi:DNA-binding LytR/AlgR family response regulator